MQLSLRLSAIADMVTDGNRLVDVGCDHGYLPVYLIQQKKDSICHCHGCANRASFQGAGAYPAVWIWKTYIQTRLSDGLEESEGR